MAITSSTQETPKPEAEKPPEPKTLEQEIDLFAEHFPKIAELLRAGGKFFRV